MASIFFIRFCVLVVERSFDRAVVFCFPMTRATGPAGALLCSNDASAVKEIHGREKHIDSKGENNFPTEVSLMEDAGSSLGENEQRGQNAAARCGQTKRRRAQPNARRRTNQPPISNPFVGLSRAIMKLAQAAATNPLPRRHC